MAARVFIRSINKEEDDLLQCLSIYAHHVVNGVGTFEEVPPSENEFRARAEEVTGRGLPYLVAVQKSESKGLVVGFAYANFHNSRTAWRYTVETSIYVKHDFSGIGIGSLLLSELVSQCESIGMRQMMARIGGGALNVSSVRLHSSNGFESVGLLKNVGWKFDRWLDVLVMQRAVGRGSSEAPRECE
jgi:L-amino acid N-acyltransferase YncA